MKLSGYPLSLVSDALTSSLLLNILLRKKGDTSPSQSSPLTNAKESLEEIF